MPQNQRPIVNNHYHQAREKTAKEKEIEDYKYKQTMKAKAREERAETVGIVKFIIMIMLCITLFRVVSTPADKQIIQIKNTVNNVAIKKQVTTKNEILLEEKRFLELEEEQINVNFFKHWIGNFKEYKKFDRLTLLEYILSIISNKNTCDINVNLWAKKFNVTRQTISKQLHLLEDDDYLKWKTNIIIVNPDRYFKGKAYKRNEIQDKYFYF